MWECPFSPRGRSKIVVSGSGNRSRGRGGMPRGFPSSSTNGMCPNAAMSSFSLLDCAGPEGGDVGRRMRNMTRLRMELEGGAPILKLRLDYNFKAPLKPALQKGTYVGNNLDNMLSESNRRNLLSRYLLNIP